VFALLCGSVLAARTAQAQAPAARDTLSRPESSTADVSAPSLKTRVEAAYPQDALRARLEATVGLEIAIDETGDVTVARVTSPAGHGFDEAALEAVKRFKFDPAMQGDRPVRSVVELAYEFHLPPPATEAPTAAPKRIGLPTPRATVAPDANRTTLVLAQRPISAASSFAVQDREFQLRPIGSVQDVLRVTPGLVLVQHSGGGKANQYFLRGFDADHGTDVALSIDGVPINMVSHAHGQGFADTNFIIPEAIERVEITKGPYFANQGDFATAGAVNLVTRNQFDGSSVGFGLQGSPGHGALGYRGLLIASPKWDIAKATFAAEIGRQNGPFENPERWDKYKLFNKVSFDIGKHSQLSIGEMSYAGNWYGSGQIPSRAVEQGLISRFGSLDPEEGGNSARHQIYAQYRLRQNQNSELRVLSYLGSYSFNLFSNFTLFARDAENGDEIEQVDRRVFYGGRASYRVVQRWHGVRFDTTIGADLRSDDIHAQLFNSAQRKRLGAVRDNGIRQTLIGAFVSEEITPRKWLRFMLGARADSLNFAVDDRLARSSDGANPESGVGSAQQLSPKASAIISASQQADAQLEFYLNWGHGFHSNDVRGAFATPAVTPLTRAIGEELGARTRLFRKLDLAGTAWLLDLANETVWSGDEGTTEVSGETRRYGLEFEGRYEPWPWLSLDGAVTFTHSQFSTDGANGGGLALGPKQTWSGGVSTRHVLGPGIARAGLRFYGIGDRPASEDGVLVAPGFTEFDLHTGYRIGRFDIALDVENLLNSEFRSAQFATVSRLRGEPAIGSPLNGIAAGMCGSNGRVAVDAATGGFGGCENVNYTPAYPFTARVMATLFLD
jgi:TonB family protein